MAQRRIKVDEYGRNDGCIKAVDDLEKRRTMARKLLRLDIMAGWKNDVCVTESA
jgi:hypothetical protein